MVGRNKEYVPRTLDGLADFLSRLWGDAPTFKDRTGHAPWQSIDTMFVSLDAGLKRFRPYLGEPLYHQLQSMSVQLRAHFEADPEETTGETRKGKFLAQDMVELIDARVATLRAKCGPDWLPEFPPDY
jgi:hypothetical protein